MFKWLTRLVVVLPVAFGLGNAGMVSLSHAEVSQRDQEEAAQRADQASADEYNDVAREAQQAQDAAEAIRDGAIEIEKDLATEE